MKEFRNISVSIQKILQNYEKKEGDHHMMDNENQNQPNQKISFESLDILIGKWRDGTFSEIIDDWKWIFSYSKRYKGAIAFYTILGIFSTSMGLVGSVASKYMIDIITGYQMSKLWIMVLITLGSAFLV